MTRRQYGERDILIVLEGLRGENISSFAAGKAWPPRCDDGWLKEIPGRLVKSVGWRGKHGAGRNVRRGEGPSP